MSFAIALICCCLVPLTMLLCGVWMLRRPPKDINRLLGYRTRRSMKNQQTWDFAHRMCGKVWTIAGTGMLVGSAAAVLLLFHTRSVQLSNLISFISYAQIILLLLSVVPVERALRRHFDDDGNPKDSRPADDKHTKN